MDYPYGVLMSPPTRIRASALLAVVVASAALSGCASLAGATSPAPTSTSAPAFTEAELAQTCVDATSSAFGADVEFDIESTRIEERTVDPQWLVLVPAHTAGYDGEAQCTIGGSPEEPVIEMSTASINPLPEEQIQNLIVGENEGGTK